MRNIISKFLTLLLLAMSIGNVWGADFTPADITKSGGTTTSNVKVSSNLSTTSAKVCNESVTAVSIGGSANGNYDASYIEVQASSGYTLDSPVDVTCSVNKTDDGTYTAVVVFWDGEASATYSSYTTITLRRKDATTNCGPTSISVPSGTRTIRIYRNLKVKDGVVSGASGCTTLGSGQTTYIKQITATATASGGSCSAPTNAAIAGTTSYTAGEDIELTASADGATSATFTWYKGADWTTASAGSSVGTGATFTKNSCVVDDAGTYWCNISNGTGCEVQISKAITVSAAVATAPSFTSPASEPAAVEYHVGDVISALEVEATGYPTPTLQWYSNDSKSTTSATLISGEESASYTPSNAAESDLYYYCVASNSEGDAQSEYFHVTVLPALPPCYTFTSTNPAETVTFDVNDIVPGSTGGSMKVIGNTVKNTAYGVSFESSSSAQVEVTLGSLMKKGTVISVSLWSNNTGSARTLKLNNSAGATKATWSFTPSTSEGETKNYSYEVTDGDGLIGTNVLRLQRGSNIYLRSITVSNCGAELFELTSAVDPVGMATVTLSKSLIAEGGTATATYSAIDAAYEFDEWQISGTDATLSSTTANPTTITMGSTDAVVTLKLKTAAVKHTVTYYDDATELGTELVNEGSNPTGAGLAPRKLGYTFGGWSLTNGGEPIASYASVTVNADLPLYAVWNAVNCATKTGTIYTMAIAVAPAENCTIKTASGFESTLDLYQYEGIVGGEAMIGNTGSSNNCILQTNKTILLKDNVSYLKLDFDCPLAKDDKIQSNISGNTAWISTEATRPSGTSTALAVLASSSTGEFVIPAASDLIGAQTIYIWKGGGNATITSINIVRPVKHAVSFNMNGHGDAIDPQYVVDGAKATEPTPAPTASGYRFVKWQLSGADYDFDAVVTGNITLDAVWQKTWTVTFNADNGETPAEVVVDHNTAVAAPDPAPTKAGNDFDGWFYGEPAALYDFATLVTENLTLTAHWTPLDNDASISALTYDGNAIDLASGVEVAGVMTYDVLLPWGVTPDKDLITVTKSAMSASVGTISYDAPTMTASFTVTAGDGITTADYAIVFANDAKKGTSIVKAVVAGGDQTAGFDATGIYGDKGYANTRSNKKLDTADKFVGVKLLAGKTFAAGDKLFVVTSTDADRGYIELYSEAAGTNLIKATGVRDASAGIEIPSELVGMNEFYIVRKTSDGDQSWNGILDYVEVTREMNPAIKSFKFGENAATINEGAKTISIEVPYGTDVTALTPTVEAYGNNGATYTPAGATDFTSSVDYVVTDGYSEFNTTYAVTVNVAAPSENANLASLTVAGYTLDFDPAVVTYNVVLDYGTTVLPTITYEVEEVGLATADKVEDGVNGATTITVTPQAGAGYEKVYTINFSVNTTPKYVIYDGSTGMTAFTATSFEDDDTHFAWAIGSGITPSADNVPNTTTYSNVWDGKTYTKMLKSFKPQDSNTTQLTITVPENYLAKIRLVGTTNSNESMRKMFVSKEASRNAENALDGYIIESDSYNASGFVTNYLLPGVYYIGSTDACRLYELSVTLTPIDYSRTTTEGRYGTICLPKAGVMVGAELYEVAYLDNSDPYQKIFLDEVPNGEMVAGRPYVFLPKVGETQLGVFYTGTDEVTTAGNYRGLYGSYTKEELPTDGSCYILLNNQYRQVVESPTYVGANKAYFKVGVTGGVPTDAFASKPGIKRVGLGVAAPQTPTDIDNLNATDAPVKVMINGQMYILRGEKMYNANGQLVK